jgi:hypothetical protein
LDGVVIAADGLAHARVDWHGHALPTGAFKGRKIQLLPGSQIAAFSTDNLGLADQFGAAATEVAGGIESAPTPIDHASNITRAILPRLLSTAAVRMGDSGIVPSSTTTKAALAFPHNGIPRLYTFNSRFLPSPVHPETVMTVLGGGKLSGDAFAAYLLDVFGSDPPTVRQGTLLALWTIDYASRALAGVFGEPIAAAVLERDSDRTYIARELARTEIDEQRRRMNEVESGLRRWWQRQAAETG